MKLFIDTSSLIHYPCGIGVYALQLLRNLEKFSDLEMYTGLKCLSIKPHHTVQHILSANLKNKLSYHAIHLPGRWDFSKSRFGRLFSFCSTDYDVAHFVGNVVPACVPYSDLSNVVLTIHDLFFWHPELSIYEENLISYYRQNIPRQAESCRLIITVSEFSKKEIIKFLGIPSEKIYVIPIATQWSHPMSEQHDILARYGLEEKRFFLSVSSLNQHKNFTGLCHAFAKYHNSKDYAGEKLVVVGGRRYGDENIYDLFLHTPDVIHIPRVSEEELRYLYAKAKGFFLVSKLEGFGIPLLEAMSSHTPACYGKGNSMDEIGRDAAVGVDPDDIDGIANVFRYFSAAPEDLQKRVEEAYQISQEYTWQNVADKHYELYKQMCQK